MVRCIEGLSAYRAEPSFGRHPRSRGDRFANLFNDISLLIGGIIRDAAIVRHPMAQPLPVPFLSFSDDVRTASANVRVEQHTWAQTKFVQHLHDSKDSHSQSVVAQRIRLNVG